MAIECAYSFYDLFHAAYQRQPSIEEIAHFENLSQSGKNELVKQWAEVAGWETEDRTGDDEQIYTAFAPTFNPEQEMEKLAEFGIHEELK